MLTSIVKKCFKNSYLNLFIYSVFFTVVSFVSANIASIIYDYPFHMGRIIGLAQSIENGDLLPNLNYLFLNGSGYGVAMFYGNWMFYIPALVFIKTKVGTFAFTTFVWQSTFASASTTYFVLEKMTADRFRSFLGAIAVSCSVVYFGYGMTAVVPLIPLLLYGLYKVLYKNSLNPIPLGIVVALLVQTHIISTIILAICSIIIVLFNIRQLTYKKVISFLSSLFLSFLFTAGFIFQYIEQSISQNFFVNWKLRDFPFPTASLMEPRTIAQIFGDYYWPVIFIFLLLGFICIRKLDSFSRGLLFTTILMFVFSTQLLPWDILRETFLSVLQRTERLIYLLPVFVIIALAKTAPKKLLVFVTILQVVTYLYNFPMRFTFDVIPYAEIGFQDNARKILDNTNRDALSAYTDPFEGYTYSTSGDEYLTIDVNHDNIRDRTITQFEYDQEKVQITNVKNGYNSLEFDAQLINGAGEQTVVLPRIWYKGYTAEYSNGGSGNQPGLLYNKKTTDELNRDRELGKPDISDKVMFDGRAVVQITNSGHVKVSYQKTLIQWTGYIIEFMAFTFIFIYLLMNSYKQTRLHQN